MIQRKVYMERLIGYRDKQVIQLASLGESGGVWTPPDFAQARFLKVASRYAGIQLPPTLRFEVGVESQADG